MAISPPRWASNAIPTTKGWVVGKELVKAQRFTPEQVNEFYGKQSPEPVIQAPAPVVPAPEPNPVAPEPIVLPPALESMTKKKLIEYAENNNIEIDATANKAPILATIKEALGL